MLTFSGTVAVENKTCATSDVEHFLSVSETLPFSFFRSCHFLSNQTAMHAFSVWSVQTIY